MNSRQPPAEPGSSWPATDRRRADRRSSDLSNSANSEGLRLSWVLILGGILTLGGMGYTQLQTHTASLESQKLDKATFEEHNKMIAAMRDDIAAIRRLVDQHGRFTPTER